MDEFEFDDSPTSTTASAASSTTTNRPLDASSPLRGRTKARRSRQTIRTGAQALQLRERLDRIDEEFSNDDVVKNGRKRAVDAADTLGEQETPQSFGTLQSSAKKSDSSSSFGSKSYRGGRRKKRKTTSSVSSREWTLDDFEMGTPSSSTTAAEEVAASNTKTDAINNGGNVEFDLTPPSNDRALSPTTPPTQSQSGSRVRFSLSSNTQHYYGTPSSLESQRVEIHSSQSCNSSKSGCKSDEEPARKSECDQDTNDQSVTNRKDTPQSLEDSIVEHEESAFVISTQRPPSKSPKKPPCLKSTTLLKKRDTDSPSPTKSNHSASSYGSLRHTRRHRSRLSTQQYSQQSLTSDDGSPQTIIVGHNEDIQDVGSYRMMIDDLSYLCSAILGCRQKRQQQHQQPQIRHNAITAGAACDLAETLSKPEMQMALLILGGQKNIGAVLEAVACAPFCLEGMEVQNVVIGKDDMLKYVETDDKQEEKFAVGRTKNARRKLSVVEATKDCGVVDIGKLPQTRDKYHVIASQALSIVAHYVSVLCTAKTTNPQIHKNAATTARDAVLAHKMALRGLARLVWDDPVVDAYLRPDNGTEDADLTSDKTNKEQLDDQSAMSSNSKLSNSLSISLEKTSDPTRLGRRKGRKKKPSRLQRAISSSHVSNNLLEPLTEVDDTDRSLGNFSWASAKSKESHEELPTCNGASNAANDKSDSLSFASEDASNTSQDKSAVNGIAGKVELKSTTKYQEKIASALSRANLNHSLGQALLTSDLNSSQDDNDWTCTYCNNWEKHLLADSNADQQTSSFPATSASLALDAADRIISGKANSIPQEGDDEDHSDEEDSDDNFLDAEKSNELTKNPILFANEMLRKSGSLAEYSRSMASTIASILLLFRSHIIVGEAKPRKCNKCMTYLQHRACTLSGIIDNLCCLSPEASKALSLSESLLIPSLIQVISDFHHNTNTQQSLFLEDTVMTALKTLTTLTHENASACDQLIEYCERVGDNSILNSGVEIIFGHLYSTVTERSDHNSSYDAIIFCLNILTNVAEMTPSSKRELFLDLLIDEGLKGITWLTQWIVSKTAGFQLAVMKGSFGSTANLESIDETHPTELQSGEEGNLVTAGNGFVLLAYLMSDEDNGIATANIREIITKELPVDESGNSGGIQFMIKTLKAFCNFYHYSVGDLSVAVVAPVIKLIAGLERIDRLEPRANWL